MKQFRLVALAGLVALFFTACGGGSSSGGSTPPQPTPPISDIKGTGTINDPYIVGSGEYSFEETEYFSLNVNTNNCNILIYNINGLDYVFGPHLFDSNFVEINTQTEEYIYPLLAQGTYSLKADTWLSIEEGEFGIFSPCINQPNGAYAPSELQEGVVEQSGGVLYSVTSNTNRTITINVIEGYPAIYLYDSALSLMDEGEYDQSYTMNLTSGVNYIYVRETLINPIKLNISFN